MKLVEKSALLAEKLDATRRRAILEHAFKMFKEEALKYHMKRRYEFAGMVYAQFCKVDEKTVDLNDMLEKGYYVMSKAICVKWDSDFDSLYFDDLLPVKHLDQIPDSTSIVLDEAENRDVLVADMRALKIEARTIMTSVKAFQGELSALLKVTDSVSELVYLVPELRKYMPKRESDLLERIGEFSANKVGMAAGIKLLLAA